jgi:hypothetical protein
MGLDFEVVASTTEDYLQWWRTNDLSLITAIFWILIDLKVAIPTMTFHDDGTGLLDLSNTDYRGGTEDEC